MATLTVEIDDALVTIRLARPHGNAINPELVADLSAALGCAGADPQVRAVLLAGAGKLFCPGLDLQELIELERPAMEHFLHAFNACILGLYTFPKPLVAAIGGHAVAGGCVLALTADWRVLRRGALIGLAETRVGVPFPFGVAALLRQAVAPQHLEEVVLFGRNYSDEDAVAAGLAHEIHEADGLEAHAGKRLAELADKDPRAFEITKRYLRATTAEHMRENDPAHAHEFLDAWFSPATRERVERVVRELRRG